MKIITWNMQGSTGSTESKWATDIPRLFADAQVLCLQECGALPPSVSDNAALPWLPKPPRNTTRYVTKNYGTNSRPNLVSVLWVETDPTGHRVNLAIAFKPSAVTAADAILIRNPDANGRPAIGIRFQGTGNPFNVYTVHAKAATHGKDGPDLVQGIVGFGGAFFAAGDYNRLPTAWNAVPAGAVLCPNNGDTTHPGSGTNLDYAFRNAAAGAVTGVVWNNFVVSDHYPVQYTIPI